VRKSSSDGVTDAHLAALAIEHGLTLCSTDGDFVRFPGLRWGTRWARRRRDENRL
jgi:predicted nucleic acid-binding protein